MKAKRILPWIFIFSALILAAESMMNEKFKKYVLARNVLTNHLGETRASAVNMSWQIANDGPLLDNLTLGNLNTLGQALQNNLRTGVVSQIEIIDSDCNLMVRVPVNSKPMPSTCKPGIAAMAKSFWQKSLEGEPVFTVQIPRKVSEKSYIVQSHVRLDQAWLSTYPALFSLVQNNIVSLFQASSSGLIWLDAKAPSGEHLLSLHAAGWIARYYPNFMDMNLSKPSQVVWLVFLTLGIIIAVMYFQASVESNNSNIAFDQARNLIESWRKRFLLGSDGSEEKLDSWGVLVAAISRYGEKIASQKEIQIRLMKDRLDKTTQAVVERDRHLSDLQEKLTGMSDLASLKEQLQHSSSSFLNKMQEVRSHCEDIFDLASKGLATSGKGLQEFTKRWQAGVEDSFHKERGARKFFRTLSETPGSRVGLTKLDDDLSDLVTLSSSALDQTLHIAMLSRQVLAELEEGVQVAALWQGLAMRDFQKDQTCDWRDCLNAAQRLVGADGRYGSLTFESMPNVQNPEELYLPITKVSLISGFFHLYMALLADVTIDAISMPIVLRQKRISDQGTIIFSLPHPAHDVADSAPGRGQQYHMEIAKAILGPAGVRVSFLPPTVAGVPVAVMWPLPTRQVEIVPTAEPTMTLS